MHLFEKSLVPEKDVPCFGSLLSSPLLKTEREIVVKGKIEPKIEDLLHDWIHTVFKV